MGFLGIDNGVSGTIGYIGDNSFFKPMPVKKDLNYTKEKAFVNRIDLDALRATIDGPVGFCLLERPMINPMRFKASVSAIRAMEATIIFLETTKIPYAFIDSKEWQKALLPHGLKGEELKEASMMVGKRLFPQFAEFIQKHGDADGMLIAEYCKIKHGGK